uniref:Presequence protease, mitochondrial n=1 Tax=Strigamia maritima TaxID=126957 RepID=T1IPH2_STRMM
MRFLLASKLFSRLKNRRFTSILTATKPTEAASTQLSLKNFNPGTKTLGFTVKNVQPVPELLLTVVELTHDQTGAEYIHVARNDDNNAFSIAFRTTPTDSTGVSHILEHTVLCGSKKYPCRDPFFKMANRSLATYMNALTGLDYTMYPFATQNAKDFRNLMNVYIDAVFAPHLREIDFRQEGWRLENENINDPNSPLVVRGIVFNEMKGAFANSEDLFGQRLINNLLPTHTYANVSGGEPIKILDLTWDQLKHFHQTHYHPSNSRIYTYGNFPLNDHLQALSEALSTFSPIQASTEVPFEQRWTEPRKMEISCRVDPLLPNSEKNTTLAMSYLLGCTSDVQENATLQILSLLLTSEPNSPFYKSLLEPNIGANYSPYTGYLNHTREGMFSIGLQGVYPNDVEKVCGIIETTFDEVIKNGFHAKEIEAVLHNIELGNKLVTTNFGLDLAMCITPLWNHNANVTDMLKVNEIIRKFRENWSKNPQFLQDLVTKYFKNNPHRLTLVMKPESTYEQNESNQETEKLKEMTKKLNEEEKRNIHHFGLKLKAHQDEKEDISCLPTLQLSDIKKEILMTDFEKYKIAQQPVYFSVQPTNGVNHFRGLFSIADLPANLRSLVPLFCNVATKMGAGDYDYKKLSQNIDLHTGGMNLFPNIENWNHLSYGELNQGIGLHSHCLDRNTMKMFELWNLIFNNATFNNVDRLSTLIQMETNKLVSGLPTTGSAYAVNCASSSLTKAASLKFHFSGMKYVTEMRKLAEKSDLTDVLSSLQLIADSVFVMHNCSFAMNSSSTSAKNVLEELIYGLKSSTVHLKPSTLTIERPSRYHYVLPLPVNYIGKSILTVLMGHRDSANLAIAAEVMTNKFLHREIREKGGAYGGRAMYDNTSGIFSFYSYRDPNNLKTLDMFNEAVDWIIKGEFTLQDVDEAKLSIFQRVDKPMSPGDRGSRMFFKGSSDDEFQEYRKRLFASSKDKIVEAAKKYLADPRKTGICILGPECSTIKNDRTWLTITEYKEL